MGIKPKRVDTISPQHELYVELKNHPIGIAITIILSLLLGILLSGFFYISYNHLVTTFTSSVRKIDITFISLLECGLFKWWFLSIFLFLLLIWVSFKIFRAFRKDYQRNFDENYLKSKNNTYGGSHFQSQEEIEKNCNMFESIEDTKGDILGIYDKYLLTLKKFGFTQGANRNYLYFGPPGIGKTSSIVKTDIYQAIRRGESIIVVDSKGTVYNETSAVARKCGYKVRVLNLKPDELKNSDGFNLFATLSKDDPSIDVQADVITTILLQNSQTNPNSDYQPGNYWYDNEFNIIKMIIMMHATDNKFIKQGKNSLAGVYDYLIASTPESLAKDLSGYDKDSTIYQCFSIFNSIKDLRIQGQIVNGAQNRLGKIGNKIVKKIVSNDEIDTILPMKEKCIYYVVISDQENTYRFLSSLFFTRIFIDQCKYSDSLSREQKKFQLPVHYILDECKATGGILGLEDKIATVRSRKMALTLIFQNTTQLNMMYGEEGAETIKECCYIKALLGGGGLTTTKEFSEMLGPQTIVTESHRFTEATADVMHAHNETQKTLSENERPLMYATDMINGELESDEILYVINGMPPLRLRKYFSEFNGEPIHPMEALGIQLGEKKSSLHKPKWRFLEEEAAKRQKALVLSSGEVIDNENGEILSYKEQVNNSSADEIANDADTFGYTEE